MPAAKYTGNEMGSGNPPGKYSSSYTSDPKTGTGNFNKSSGYRGDMHVGINDSAPVVGNQPKQTSTRSIESSTNKEDSI